MRVPQGAEHLRGLERKSKDSVLHRHITADHGEEGGDARFEMKVTGRFKDCLKCQISEALAIRIAPQDSLINSKSEFYQPCVKKKIYAD